MYLLGLVIIKIKDKDIMQLHNWLLDGKTMSELSKPNKKRKGKQVKKDENEEGEDPSESLSDG